MPYLGTCTETTGLNAAGCWLVYPNTPIGDYVISWKTSIRRATEINVRQNFWSNRVVLDGRYPAFYYIHDFILYQEHVSPAFYTQAFFNNFRTYLGSQPVPLALRSYTSLDDVIAFGSCLMEPPEQNSPEELLFYKAGYFRLQFKGTEIPSVCSSTYI